jgi:hypothetical protein
MRKPWAFDEPKMRERLLKSLKSTTGKTLLEALIRDRGVEIRAFARHHTHYDTTKVHRALRGIFDRQPGLEAHIEVDERHIRLVDKPAPI